MHLWHRLVGDRPIVTRLVLAVAATMAVVLLLSSFFVFERVQYALDRQVDQDLAAYREVVEEALAQGRLPAQDTPGESYQVFNTQGSVVGGNAVHLLARPRTVALAAAGEVQHHEVGHLLPPSPHPYRVVTARLHTPRGRVVVSYAISRVKHDEALRELLLQLMIADLITLAAASVVGFGTARAALNPVERYRRAAQRAGESPEVQLPVPVGRDDELTRLGHTFNDLLARIARGNERERQFLADASHELRSPLSVMRTELEWAMLRPRGPQDVRTTLTSLHHQVDRLVDLCNALLNLEELRSTDQPMVDLVDVGQVAAEVADEFAVQADAVGREVRDETSGEVTVCGNARWLELAVANLVSNSLRYGAGTVRVSVVGEPDRVRLGVSDEGPGFPPEFVAKAFDRFSRADASRSTAGTGLGLAIVRAVAEAHGGSARIDGAEVTLLLPRGATAAAAPAETPRGADVSTRGRRTRA
ncbi:MAG TPA: HAMP domain-containing sensor histidine kinase [Marmoricola sp.]|nr:HAMP domain-containing sensor histidine kinase [Marmoricola sp.]